MTLKEGCQKTILIEINNIKPLKVIQIFWQGLYPLPLLEFCPNKELHKKVLQKHLAKDLAPAPPPSGQCP